MRNIRPVDLDRRVRVALDGAGFERAHGHSVGVEISEDCGQAEDGGEEGIEWFCHINKF